MAERLQFSIHPRNWPGGDRVKTNTCGRSSRAWRLASAIAGMERHLATNSRDTACRERRDNAKATLAELHK